MKLEIITWFFGALSAVTFAWPTFRASLLYRQAQRMQDRIAGSQPSEAKLLFEDFSKRLKLEAGWRPKDHWMIIIAIISLSVNQIFSIINLLS